MRQNNQLLSIGTIFLFCEFDLEAFAVNNSWASLVELLLGDPHFLEGGERSQDGATDPDGVLSLGRSDDLDLHGGRSQGGDLLLHTIGDTGVHGGATGEDSVGVQILLTEKGSEKKKLLKFVFMLFFIALRHSFAHF